MTEKINILLVDDNKENLIVLSNFLKGQGYNIALSFDGKTAIDIAKSNKIDLILIDIMMPEIDGFETFEFLQSHPETKDIPVVFLTAKTGTEDIIRAFKIGGSDYITKPYIKEELLARINNHINRKIYREKLIENNRKLSSAIELLDTLLLNILPKDVANDFKKTGKSEPKTYKNVTIMVSDLVNFTRKTCYMKSEVFFSELNELYTGFDAIMKKNDCERIKTIGDAYLAVCGMSETFENHALKMSNAAVEIVQFLNQRNLVSEFNWEVRIGLHSGEIIGGIVGTEKFTFDVFGTAVNTAFRMESLSEPMRINVSHETYNKIINHFNFTERQMVPIKGIDALKMYFINL
jgi:DNA-binding response OmpR family regulator